MSNNTCYNKLGITPQSREMYFICKTHDTRINERYDAAKEVCAGWLGTNTKSAFSYEDQLLP